MEKRYRFARLCVVVFAVAFVLCFAVATAAFVIARNQRPEEFQELKKELEKRKAADELKEERERRKASEEKFAAKLQDLAVREPTPEVEGFLGELRRLDRDIERQEEGIRLGIIDSLVR